MASKNSHISTENEEYICENGVVDGVMGKKIDGVTDCDLCIELLRREFHRSLDLNQPILGSTSIELTNSSNTCYDMIGAGYLKEGEKNKNLDLDLSLSLSPPGKNSSKDESETSSSSPLSQRSCMSLDLNLIEELESRNTPELPSLVLMGCSHCLIYVMVSEVDPKCPNCQTSILIDIFREKPAKRSRIN